MPISFINTEIYKAYSNENIRKIHVILVVRNTLYVYFFFSVKKTPPIWPDFHMLSLYFH